MTKGLGRIQISDKYDTLGMYFEGDKFVRILIAENDENDRAAVMLFHHSDKKYEPGEIVDMKERDKLDPIFTMVFKHRNSIKAFKGWLDIVDTKLQEIELAKEIKDADLERPETDEPK